MATQQFLTEPDRCNTQEGDCQSSSCACNHPKPSKWQIACTKCLARQRSRERKKSRVWDYDGIFDAYRTFEVEQEDCYDIEVTVQRGENISKGSKLEDSLDTPDPYIVLRIPQLKMHTPKRTTTEDNSINPRWDQTFHFYLYKNTSELYTMEISLMDENVLVDEAIDSQTFPLDSLEEGIPKDCTFSFKGGSKVFINFLKQKNQKTDLRFSMSLCDEEKVYLRQRRENICESMQTLLGDDGPESQAEAPVIGILGSGGGYRAMIGLSGALRALQDSGIFDCTTYLAGLSGSTWCISTLYCQDPINNNSTNKENENENDKEKFEKFDSKKENENKVDQLGSVVKSTEEFNLNSQTVSSGGLNVKEFQKTLCESVGKTWEWNILKMPQYMGGLLSKYWKGQSQRPVTLVDIFGHLIGDVLLGKEKKNTMKLSHLQGRLSEGKEPFPLFAALHATDKSSNEFAEWIEFSPYEIGMGKYGTFMKTEDFGCKFFAGKLLKKFEEMPLHYLQGIWGSAFTVNLKKHLIGKTNNTQEGTDEYKGEEKSHNGEEHSESDIESDDSEDEIEDSHGKRSSLKIKKCPADKSKRLDSCSTFKNEQEECLELKVTVHRGESITKGSCIKDALDTPDPYIVLRILDAELYTEKRTMAINNSTNPAWDQTFYFYLKKCTNCQYAIDIILKDANVVFDEEIDTQSFQLDSLDEKVPKDHMFTFKGGSKVFVTFLKQKTNKKIHEIKKKNWLVSSLETVGIDSSKLLNTRAVKPGRIYNPFRGLSLRYSFVPDQSTTNKDTVDHQKESLKYAEGCKYKPLRQESKKISVMDSGFAFNSPYPLLLRPQRAVDIFLSFDLSAFEKDDLIVNKDTFNQLILAESWAKGRHIPFPPVKEKICEYIGTELQECYVFESSSDQCIPVILHFPLVNNKFKQYKAPGVLRTSEEESNFAKFPCFGQDSQFSTFKFHYDCQEFERLAKVMEFNTLLHKDTIIETIKNSIIKKRQGRKMSLIDIAKILLGPKQTES